MLLENLTILGKYSLALNAIISESNATVFGGQPLPSRVLKFTIKGKWRLSTDYLMIFSESFTQTFSPLLSL